MTSKNGEPVVTGPGALLNRPLTGPDDRTWVQVIEDAAGKEAVVPTYKENQDQIRLEADILAHNAAGSLKKNGSK